MTTSAIENMFSYHRPVGDQPERYERLRAKAKELAYLISEACPESREKSLAFTWLQLTVMLANASIACNEGGPPESARPDLDKP